MSDQRTNHQAGVDALLDQLIVAKGARDQAEAMNRVYERTLVASVGRTCSHDDLLANLRGLHTPLAGGDGVPCCMECGFPSPCRTMKLLIPAV